MRNALISPNEQVQYISGWVDYKTPIYSVIPGAQRIAEVADTEFPVAPPLYWEPCTDNVVADQWYWDPEQLTAIEVPAAPPPPVPQDQPVVNGAQTI